MTELVAVPHSLTHLSLRWRLPNPPPIFLGRAEERERLAAAVERAPVAIVWGLGGLGKTSLALAVMHERFAPRVDRTLFVSLRTVDVSSHIAVEVTRALCAARGIHAVDWNALLGDEQRLVQTAIDLAEEGAHWVVIDDLHNGDAASTQSLLRDVARYARRSRWIATSRVDWPLPELEGQRIQLGGLSDRALDELARRIDPELSPRELERLVAAAAGSPWRMRMALGAESESGGDVLRGLDAAAIELVHALAPVEVPLPRDTLTRALPGTPEAWELLERYGIIEVRAGRSRLHDMARALLRDRLDAVRLATWTTRMTEALAACDEPSAWLEALRLSLASDRVAEARAILAARCEALVASGYASELWRQLEPQHHRELARWRMQSAVEVGTPEVLSLLREPPDATPDELTLWGQALFEMGRMQESADTAKRALLGAREADASATALDAELLYLHAQALANAGKKNDPLSMLTTITQAQGELQRAALGAKVYALMGAFEPALKAANDLLPRCAKLPPKARLLAYLDLLATYLSAGRMLDAHDILARIDRECGGISLAHYSSRYLGVLRVSVLTHLGRFEEADAILDQILPYTGRATVQRPVLVSMRLWLRLRQGQLAGIEEQLDQLDHDLEANANEYFLQWARVLRSLYERWHAHPPPRPNAPSPALTGAGGHLLRIYRILQRVRGGEPLFDGDRAFLEGLCPDGYLHGLAHTVFALAHLLAEDGERAAREAASAVHHLERLGNHLYASEAREALCEVLLVSGRRADLERTAEHLAEDGRRFPSSRLVASADFHAMAARAPVDPAVLERLAGDPSTPTVMRRARALLGGEAPLDAIDRLVVGAIESQSGARVETLGAPGAGWRTGWGLDTLRRAVWLPDGARVELAEHPILWACLEALATLGGTASREALVPYIWPGERYDPTVHNNRLNPAIRKLRLLLEANPSRPQRLVTTPDGYGFGPLEAVRWLRPVAPGSRL